MATRINDVSKIFESYLEVKKAKITLTIDYNHFLTNIQEIQEY